MSFQPVRKHRAIRIKREPTRTPVWATQEFGREIYPREYAHELLEIARERTQDALCVTGIDCYLYRRRRVGRRCSCWQVPDAAEPNMECPVCYGTGFVGGWDKEGCVTEVFDVTYPKYDREAVVINPHAQPHYFQGSVVGPGTVVFTWDVPACRWVDAVEVYGHGVTVAVKDARQDDSHYETLSADTLEALINGGVPQIHLRVTFPDRESTLQGVYVRVGVDEVTYKVEHAQLTRSLASGEFMLPDLFDGTQAALDVNLPSDLSVEDFFEVAGKRFRFKTTDITPFESLGHGLGYEATIRPVTEFETAFKIPYGRSKENVCDNTT